jgi:putative two-component system response regulator
MAPWHSRLEGRRRSATQSAPAPRSPRASLDAGGESPQSSRERREELGEALRELGMSETNVWILRAHTIFRTACMAELRPIETAAHLRRVSAYCEILCKEIQLSAANRELTRLASQLHDVGSVVIPARVLLKQGKLTPDELDLVKEHAEAGYQALAGCTSAVVQLGAVIARSHHERWNGSGYPQGLCEREIPLLGRLVGIADTFDALTSDRPYRAALPTSEAVEAMREERGVLFDPYLIDRFLATLPELETARQADAAGPPA